MRKYRQFTITQVRYLTIYRNIRKENDAKKRLDRGIWTVETEYI